MKTTTGERARVNPFAAHRGSEFSLRLQAVAVPVEAAGRYGDLECYQESDPQERIAKAKALLGQDPGAVGAALLLAWEDTGDLAEAEAALRAALSTAEAAAESGADGDPSEDVVEARFALARVLRKRGRNKDALELFESIADADHAAGDALGVRSCLSELLVATDGMMELRRLLGQWDWRGEPNTFLLYNSALCCFRADSDMAKAMEFFELAARAVEWNPHVAKYLLEEEPVPMSPPAIVSRGESEAIAYAAAHLEHWQGTQGAQSYLRGYSDHVRPRTFDFGPVSDAVGKLDRSLLAAVQVDYSIRYPCATCRKNTASNRCARCKSVWYCSVDCQRSNWKDHKAFCKPQAALYVSK